MNKSFYKNNKFKFAYSVMKIVSSCFSTTPDNKQLHYLLRTESIKVIKLF